MYLYVPTSDGFNFRRGCRFLFIARSANTVPDHSAEIVFFDKFLNSNVKSFMKRAICQQEYCTQF